MYFLAALAPAENSIRISISTETTRFLIPKHGQANFLSKKFYNHCVNTIFCICQVFKIGRMARGLLRPKTKWYIYDFLIMTSVFFPC